jgi:Ca-activated chloride channel family protein
MLFVLLFISFGTSSIAQVRTSTSQKTPAKPVTRILFLVDASASMLNPWEERNKMDAAQQIISEFVDSLKFKNDVQVALRIYGHQSINSANDCGDTKLEVGFASGNAVAIKVALGKIRPKGITPLAFSLEKAASDFPMDASAKNIVVLVTDGEESCGGDPCAVSLKMQQKNIYLKPFVIGLNLDPAKKSAMECIGHYYNADRPSALREIMKTVIDRMLSSATVTVNLLDADGHPLETDVNMSFIDNGSGEVKYNFYHTLNYRGEPDTLQLDPVLNYDLTIHTTPPIEKEQLHFAARKNEVLNILLHRVF